MQLQISPNTLRSIEADAILGDAVKQIASRQRGASPGDADAAPQDFAAAKRETLVAVDRLEASVGNLLSQRTADEKRAETLLTWGGVFAMLLPGIGLVLNLLKVSDTWVTTALAGATLTGILTFLFKPGDKLLKLSRERQQLLVLPHAMRAKVAAASDFPSLQAAAAELAAALRGDPVQV
jgi:hypothetical protein